LQGDAAVLTNLHVNAGFRYDVYGHTDPAVNPRLAVIYDPWDKATFKAIRGHAFRAPNFFERNFNNDLIPEKIVSHELVYEQGIGNNLRSSVSGFYNQIDHLINFNSNTNPVYQNVKGATARGLELELQAFWSSGLRGRVSYTLQDTEFHQAGVVRSDSPKHLGKLNLIAPLLQEKVFAGLEFQFTSRRLTLEGTETSGFGVVNFTLFSQNLAKGLELSGSIYNLLDRHYSDPATPFLTEEVIPRDGRTFRVKLTYRF
jgi:iron complex outermembrane receptor protein